ncbi:MAG: hypothetical protein SGARI_001322 [Bacillariaceae sp.]
MLSRRALIKTTLLTHVIAGKEIRSSQLKCGERYYMASGELTKHICKSDGGRIQNGDGNNDISPYNANIEATNIEVCEGIVHVVDDVIIPGFDPDHHPEPCPYPGHHGCKEPVEPYERTIGDIACKSDDFETLCDLIQGSAYLKSLLFDPYQSLTVFAPTDSAFYNIRGTLDGLSDREVDFVLRYHIVDEELFADDLSCSYKYDSFIQMINGLFTETKCYSEAIFQVGTGNDSDDKPRIIDTDIVASNGVIHVVDEVILPEIKPEQPDYKPDDDYHCSAHYSYPPEHDCYPRPEHPIEHEPEYPYECTYGYYYPRGHRCYGYGGDDHSVEGTYSCMPGYYYPRGHPCNNDGEGIRCSEGYYYPYGHPCHDGNSGHHDGDHCAPGYYCNNGKDY